MTEKYRYKKADRYVEFNKEDNVLETIHYKLPKPPKPQDIDGYGLDPREQMWKPPQMPLRLKQLQQQSKTLDDLKEKLYRNQKEYAPEIAWIKREWDRRINGYWLYIHGKPTYMDGWHYFYCGYWNLDSGLPDYRYRDYLFFHFARFCYTDTTLPDGTDLFRRLCYGFNYPKHRREGATYKAECVNYEIISRTRNVHGGIQSMDGDSAKDAFLEKLVQPWQKLPFYFKPKYTGSTAPKSVMNFDEPSVNITSKGGVTNIDIGLQSKITYASTAGRGFFDGKKLKFYHDDECGKTKEENIYARHMVVKKCLSQANGRMIHGLTIKTSTVGEMNDQGGRNFYNLCKDSMYQNRNDNGETITGLYNLFIPAYVCLDGFVDIFGNPIVENPTEEDIWRIPHPTRNKNGELIGAKKYLENVRDAYLNEDDSFDSQTNFEEEVRLAPMSFDECFITAGSLSGLPIQKVVKRMKELQFVTNAELGIEIGDFEWVNGQKDTTVVFNKKKGGKFKVSHLPPINNGKEKGQIWDLTGLVSTWRPSTANKMRFVSSADPYYFLKTESNRLSKGAGSTFMLRDESIDPDDKDISLWETHRNVCTYINRPPDPDDYAEDMLMMCVFYQSLMFPEINQDLIWKHFRRRGYLGYLLYAIEPSGRKKNTPGFYNKGAIPQDLFNAHKRYLEYHSGRERHIEVLEECKLIKGIEDLTNRDLFVAVGGAYLAADQVLNDPFRKKTKKNVNVNSFFPSRRY